VKMWESRYDVDAFPVLAIHDEVVVEAPEEKAHEVKEWLTTCMVEGMAAFLREVPVKVEIAVKDSWG
ncbi:MAG: DNA polymerase, partial [SAR202 cluster bacterium]|nr:DNA polymerase [SAR202 cluster bacterium]